MAAVTITKSNVNSALRLSLALAGLLLSRAAVAGDGGAIALGEAFHLKDDRFLYSETYCAGDTDDEIEVHYRDAAGRMFTRKRLDFSAGAMTPTLLQRNFHTGEEIEIGMTGDRLGMRLRDIENNGPESDRYKNAVRGVPFVIDAGLDEFVRRHWDILMGGDEKRFRFPFAQRERIVELRINRDDCAYSGASEQCFKIEMANWFLRLLIAPIELGYDPGQRRLKRYRGLSSIVDDNGRSLTVDVRYRYSELPESACRIDGPPRAVVDS